MTLVEFFEACVAENICSSLVKAPDKIIFVGDNRKTMLKHADRYKAFFESRDICIEFEVVSVNRHDVATIVDALEKIAEENNDCIFDLTGGGELYIFAAGMVCERFKDDPNKRVQMHFININNQNIYDCDMDGEHLQKTGPLRFSVADDVFLYGGKVVYNDERTSGTHRWKMTQPLSSDIMKMWNICKVNCKGWNNQTNLIRDLDECTGKEDPQLDDASGKTAKEYIIIRDSSGSFDPDSRIIKELKNAKLINQYSSGKADEIVFQCKNETIKRCLKTSGLILELRIFLAALNSKDENGESTYNDVQTGVLIDWDNVLHPEAQRVDVENEIDVIMMHGMLPVFVSCKNGDVQIEELYKLNTVATRFGGKYSKKVLIAPALFERDGTESFRNRCREMNILLIDDVHKMDANELDSVVSMLWKIGSYQSRYTNN